MTTKRVLYMYQHHAKLVPLDPTGAYAFMLAKAGGKITNFTGFQQSPR